MMSYARVLLAASAVMSAGAADILVSNERAPAGGAVQIKVFLNAPAPFTSGQLRVELDPNFFLRDATRVAVFSRAGSAGGPVRLDGDLLQFEFASPDGEVGNGNGLPVAAIMAVLQSALPAGTRARVNVTLSAPGFESTASGTVTVAESPFVREVIPGSGRLSAGDIVSIRGGSFPPDTYVKIQGMVVAESRWLAPDRMDVVVGGPAELVGNRVTLHAQDAETVEYFPFSYGVPEQSNFFLIPPLREFVAGETVDLARRSGWVELYNPNTEPAEVAVQTTDISQFGVATQRVLVLGRGETRAVSWSGGISAGRARVLSSLPVRAAVVTTSLLSTTGSRPSFGTYAFVPIAMRPLTAGVAPERIDLEWNRGMPPIKGSLNVTGVERYTVEVSGGPWLSLDAAAGPSSYRIDPTGLPSGIHRAFLVVRPMASYQSSFPRHVPVTLVVNAQPAMLFTCCIEFTSGGPGPATQTFRVPPDLSPSGFQVQARTYAGGDWLSVAPVRGTAPANLSITANAAGLAAGRYAGEILITNSDSMLYVPVTLTASGGGTLRPGPPVVLLADAGTMAFPQTAPITADCTGTCWTVETRTSSGTNWLSARPTAAGASVEANASGLAPGLHTGVITFRYQATMTQVPVVMLVRSPRPMLIRTHPASLTAWSGEMLDRTFCAEGAGATQIPMPAVTTSDGGSWLKIRPWEDVRNCFIASFAAVKPASAPLRGEITAQAQGYALTVPVTLIPPALPPKPVVAGIWNAASVERGEIAPGELVSIRGQGFRADTQVTFDGILARYAARSATDILAVVPEVVEGRSVVELQVGDPPTAVAIALAPAAPGVFTANGTGRGPAVVGPVPRNGPLAFTATGLRAGPIQVRVGGIDAPLEGVDAVEDLLGGRWRIRALVPAEAPSGIQPLEVCAGGRCSQSGVTVTIE